MTHESGNTRDQLSTVYDTLTPRGFLGWGNVSSLGYSLAAVVAAKKAHPERSAVAVTGEAGLGYMMGNLEVPVREKLGVTVVHVSNGGFAGYGPGFWGEGHDPYTHRVLGPDDIDLSKALREFRLAHRAGDGAGRPRRRLAACVGGQCGRRAGLYRSGMQPVPGLWAMGDAQRVKGRGMKRREWAILDLNQ